MRYVKLIGHREISRFAKRYADSRKPLMAWIANVEGVMWENIADVRKTYATADGVVCERGAVVTVFNIKGGNYRLLALINYGLQSVTILEVLTHPEYDKDLWKKRY